MGAHLLYDASRKQGFLRIQRGLNPTKPAYDRSRSGLPAQLTASAIGQYAGIHGTLQGLLLCRTHYFCFFPIAMAKVVASTHCAYPRRDGQVELAWVAGYILKWFGSPKTVTHPSSNRA